MQNKTVTQLQATRDNLAKLDLSGLSGQDLCDAVYLLRDIPKKVKPLEDYGKDTLFMEADKVEGVYEFKNITTNRLDNKKFDTLLTERYKIPAKVIEALRAECSTPSDSLKLNFAKKYSI